MRHQFIRNGILSILTAAFLGSCTNGYHFVGRVYDGATGERLTNYEIALDYFNHTVKGNVDGDGRYVVGWLGPNHDFTVRIEKEGYRAFMSHNGMFEGEENHQSLYYDAYLFPTGMLAPSVSFDVTLSGSQEHAAGLVRIRPTSLSSLYNSESESPLGVPGQVWNNDEDVQADSIRLKEFSNSTIYLEEGELVYGVAYELTVFDVMGYQPYSETFQSGFAGHQSFTLSPITVDALAVAFSTAELGLSSPNADVTIVFNQPITFHDGNTTNGYNEALDEGFSIQSNDSDNDGNYNLLNTDDSNSAQERGTTMTIDNNRLYLSWDPTVGLEQEDGDDNIEYAVYSNLDSIEILSTRGPSSNHDSLAALLGSSAITVPVNP